MLTKAVPKIFSLTHLDHVAAWENTFKVAFTPSHSTRLLGCNLRLSTVTLLNIITYFSSFIEIIDI